MRLTRKPIAVAAAGILSLTGATAAWAVWSSSGDGNATAKVSSAKAVTVVAATPASGDLYPGGPAGSITFTLSNPNPYPVTLTGVSYGATSDSKISVSGSAPHNVSFVLPAHASNVNEVIDGVLLLDHSADDSYQGKSFDVAISLTGSQD
jgi:hypothetical protein